MNTKVDQEIFFWIFMNPKDPDFISEVLPAPFSNYRLFHRFSRLIGNPVIYCWKKNPAKQINGKTVLIYNFLIKMLDFSILWEKKVLVWKTKSKYLLQCCLHHLLYWQLGSFQIFFWAFWFNSNYSQKKG